MHRYLRGASCALLILALLTMGGCSYINAFFQQDLPSGQQRLLAFGAVLAEKNDLGYTQLFGRDRAFLDSCRLSLENSWKITDASSAKEILAWLQTDGIRAESEEYYNADELLAIASGAVTADDRTAEHLGVTIKSYTACAGTLKEEYGYSDSQLSAVKTTAAWDLDRLVTLARWCYACEYLTEDETWDIISRAADAAVQYYGSWEEYFAGIAFGRALSLGGGFDEQAVAEKLLKSPDSPYTLYAFAPTGE